MTTTGQVFPVSGTTGVTTGHTGVAWANPGNITAQDATSAADTAHCASITSAKFDAGVESYALYANFWGLPGPAAAPPLAAIPDGSAINGVTVRAGVFCGAGEVSLDLVRLMPEGVGAGDNKAAVPVPLGGDYTAVLTFGGPSDTWGLDLAPGVFSGLGFSVEIGAVATAANSRVLADFISVEVDYTPPAG